MAEPFPPSLTDGRPFGVDVSKYNGAINWDMMKAYNLPKIEYVFIRSGQGRLGNYDDLDEKFYYNWGEAKRVVIPRMAYHVIYPSEPASLQTDNVERIFSPLDFDFGEGPLWIDFELHHNMNAEQLMAALKNFYDALVSRFSIRVGIYTGEWFLKRYFAPKDWWADMIWWLAYYGSNSDSEYSGPPETLDEIQDEDVIFHQTSSMIYSPPMGAPGWQNRIDGNRFLGDNLRDFLNIEEQPPSDLEGRVAKNEENIGQLLDRLDSLEGRVDRHLQE